MLEPRAELARRLGRFPLIAAQLELVELAAQARLVLRGRHGDHAEHDLVVVRVRVGLAFPADELQFLVRLPRLEPVGPAADGLADRFRRVLGLRESRGGDDRQVEGVHPLGVRLREPHAHGGRVGRLDGRQVLVVRAPDRSGGLRVVKALDREADVVGGDGRARLPRVLRIEVELVRETVGRHGPGGGERRHRLSLGVDPDERAEDHLLDEQAPLLGRRRRIEARRIAGQVAHERRLLRRRRRGAPAGQRRDDSEDSENPRKALHRGSRTE